MRHLRLLAVCYTLLLATACETKNIGYGFFHGALLRVNQAGHSGQPYPGAKVELHLVYMTGNTPADIEWTLGDWADPPAISFTDDDPKQTFRQPSTSYPVWDSVSTVEIVKQQLTEPREVTAHYKITVHPRSELVAPAEGNITLCLLPALPDEPTFTCIQTYAMGQHFVELSASPADQSTYYFLEKTGALELERSAGSLSTGSAKVGLFAGSLFGDSSGSLTATFEYMYRYYAEIPTGFGYYSGCSEFEEVRHKSITIPINIPPAVIIPDALYAIPLQSTVTVGEPVTITVLTSDPANPFQYMTGVRVVTDAASGFDYDDGSFNVGTPGGAADDVDGIWSAMPGLTDGDFLLAPDSFYTIQDAGAGLSALDFNITPLGGSNLDSASGALFNFQATFTTPGTYVFGFQEVNVVDRTFYNDESQATIYHWGDISNTYAGVRNSVTVTP